MIELICIVVALILGASAFGLALRNTLFLNAVMKKVKKTLDLNSAGKTK